MCGMRYKAQTDRMICWMHANQTDTREAEREEEAKPTTIRDGALCVAPV